jgi:hypothetical protein
MALTSTRTALPCACCQPRMEIRRLKFPAFTGDLKQLRACLENCQVTDIAMESTEGPSGTCWRGVESRTVGKLRNSWVPPRPLRELRDLTRQRVNVLEDLNRAKNRTEQLCQTGNIKSKCLR